ncbi:hypothetical protein GWI34_23085 [Actinomadura sp. DSM 109109]|nr:hypothetical protein [Actinomadura lepetitiana]
MEDKPAEWVQSWERQQIDPHGELSADRSKLAATDASVTGTSLKDAERKHWYSHN